MSDYDATKSSFDGITADVIAQLTAEKVASDTAAKEDPLPPPVAEANREQIAATRGVVLGCSFMALAAIIVVALLGVAQLIGWL